MVDFSTLPESVRGFFGLRGFTHRRFILNRPACYVSPDNGLQLIVRIQTEQGFSDFSRTTLPELLRQVLPDPKPVETVDINMDLLESL